MCEAPPGFSNSASSTPILRRVHSTASHEPVRSAIRGMSPWLWFLGIVKFAAVFGMHELVMSTLNCRRQRPSWTTTLMPVPTGTLVRVNVPSGAVYAVTSGLPAAVAPHTSHVIPAGNGSSPGSFGSFGM